MFWAFTIASGGIDARFVQLWLMMTGAVSDFAAAAPAAAMFSKPAMQTPMKIVLIACLLYQF